MSGEINLIKQQETDDIVETSSKKCIFVHVNPNKVHFDVFLHNKLVHFF